MFFCIVFIEKYNIANYHNISYAMLYLYSYYLNMAYNIIWQKQGVLIQYYNAVNLNDLLEVNNNLLSDSRFDRCIYVMANFTNATNNNISKQDIKVVGVLHKTASNFVKIRFLILITNKPELYNLTTVYIKIMNESGVKTCRVDNYKEAVSFLEDQDLFITNND